MLVIRTSVHVTLLLGYGRVTCLAITCHVPVPVRKYANIYRCVLLRTVIVTLGKSETYKETMKEKSTILPYSIHKRIHVRPLRNLIQGIHVNVNTIQSTVLKEAAIRNSGLRHARAGNRTHGNRTSTSGGP